MDKVNYRGHQVPIISKSGTPGDIGTHPRQDDKDISPAEADFIHRNEELQGDIGAATPPTGEEGVRRSTLVEIPTPTSRVIYKISAVFPFDFFPNSLVIDELKVSFIYNQFLSRQVNSILIKDITDVQVSSSVLFGALLITGGDYQGVTADRPSDKGPLTINYLNKQEAFIARRIIMGLMIFYSQKVDTSQMSISEIIQKTDNLGKAREI